MHPMQDPARFFADRRSVVNALAVAAAGAAVFAVLAGPASLGAGLVVVAGAIGRFVGLALRGAARGSLGRRNGAGLAVALTGIAVALGEVGTWLYARWEGGVLPLVPYVAEVHGPLAPAALLVGAAAAWWSAR